MTFVQARSKLSEIVDRVAEHGDAYVVSKRQKPVAVIIGIDNDAPPRRYDEAIRELLAPNQDILNAPH